MTTKNTAAVSAPARKTPVKKAVPLAKPRTVPAVKKAKKEPKVKVVRDSFTMPDGEYRKISGIKEICAKAGQPVKKSEVLRAGLKVLAAMTPARIRRELAGLEKIKTGRPKKP